MTELDIKSITSRMTEFSKVAELEASQSVKSCEDWLNFVSAQEFSKVAELEASESVSLNPFWCKWNEIFKTNASSLNIDCSTKDNFRLLIPERVNEKDDDSFCLADPDPVKIPMSYEDWLNFVSAHTLIENSQAFFYLDKWSFKKCVSIIITDAGFMRIVIKIKKNKQTGDYYPVYKRQYLNTEVILKKLKSDPRYSKFLDKVQETLSSILKFNF